MKVLMANARAQVLLKRHGLRDVVLPTTSRMRPADYSTYFSGRIDGVPAADYAREMGLVPPSGESEPEAPPPHSVTRNTRNV